MTIICEMLHKLANSIQPYEFPFDTRNIPANGIYVLFEKGEYSHGRNRIVRVGTHTGKGQLPSRLQQHFLKENKDRSIFRKNIGRAILNRDNDPFISQWELDLTTKEARLIFRNQLDVSKQIETEKKVTEYIQWNFKFVVFQIDEKETRLDLESKIISTVSICEECNQSDSWLGIFSTKVKIRQSGLWQVNELYKTPLSETDLTILNERLQQ